MLYLLQQAQMLLHQQQQAAAANPTASLRAACLNGSNHHHWGFWRANVYALAHSTFIVVVRIHLWAPMLVEAVIMQLDVDVSLVARIEIKACYSAGLDKVVIGYANRLQDQWNLWSDIDTEPKHVMDLDLQAATKTHCEVGTTIVVTFNHWLQGYLRLVPPVLPALAARVVGLVGPHVNKQLGTCVSMSCLFGLEVIVELRRHRDLEVKQDPASYLEPPLKRPLQQ